MDAPVTLTAIRHITTLVTPFDTHGSLLVENVGPLIRRQHEAGLDAVLVAGPIGEGDMLLQEERQALVVAVSGATSEIAMPFLVDVSAPMTRQASLLAEHATNAGADAIVYTLPTVDGCDHATYLRSVSAIASATDLPIVLRACTKNQAHFALDTMNVLAAIPNLFGCIVDDLVCGLRLKYEFPLLVWVNADHVIGPALIAGVHGIVTGIGNLVPDHIVRLVRASRMCDVDEMRDLQRWIAGIVDLLGADLFIPRLKASMRLVGADAGVCRPPRRDLTQAEAESLSVAIRQWVHAA